MLPHALAGLSFVDAALGGDESLAARVSAVLGTGRVCVLGARRPGLARELTARGLDVVVMDSSRTALREARDALGPESPAQLLVADPRELEVPGGLDGVLLPSAVLRAITLREDRRQVMRSAARELRPGGRLLLELERLPAAPRSLGPLPSRSGGVRWRRGPAAGTVEVEWTDASDQGMVVFADFAPADAVREAQEVGFHEASFDAGADTQLAVLERGA